jgi:hypothetical protein
MATTVTAEAEGLTLTDAPGMGYQVDEGRLERTRIA